MCWDPCPGLSLRLILGGAPPFCLPGAQPSGSLVKGRAARWPALEHVRARGSKCPRAGCPRAGLYCLLVAWGLHTGRRAHWEMGRHLVWGVCPLAVGSGGLGSVPIPVHSGAH